jgi:cell division GTPase FtsZ
MKSRSMRIAVIGQGESGGNFAARLAAGAADGTANMQSQTREEAKRSIQ